MEFVLGIVILGFGFGLSYRAPHTCLEASRGCVVQPSKRPLENVDEADFEKPHKVMKKGACDGVVAPEYSDEVSSVLGDAGGHRQLECSGKSTSGEDNVQDETLISEAIP